MIEITLERAIELAKEVVEEYGGDYVYRNPSDPRACHNVHFSKDGEVVYPGCMIGCILHRAGVSLSAMAEYPDCDVYKLSSALEGFLSLTEEALAFLRNLQDNQDSRHSWGKSLYWAIREIGMHLSE